MDYKKVKLCRICGGKRLRKYLDLGSQPLANNLQDSTKSKPQKFPLEVLFCEECYLSQLSAVISPKVLYNNYPYFSSVSKTFQKHCISLAEHVNKLFKKDRYLSLIDIASNDGCLLEMFRRSGYGLMWGVEPSKNLTEKSERNGFTIINDFWSKNSCKALPQVDVITALNVFAHVDDLESFLKTVYEHLTPSGVFIIEVPYLKNLIEQNQFDTIYHEHLSYFLLHPIKVALRREGLDVFRVEEIDIHGGSLRIFSCKDGRNVESSVWLTEAIEKRKEFYNFKTYRGYAKRVEKIRTDLRKMLGGFKKLKKRVMAYGASAKGNTLLNYCGVTNTDITAIVDDTPAKQGKFTPGSKIPIVNGDHFDITHPDYIVLTAWNFSAEMKKKTEHVGAKYIVAIPEVRVE